MVKIQLSVDKNFTEQRSQYNRIYTDVDDITFKVATHNHTSFTINVEGKATIPEQSPLPVTFMVAEYVDTEDTSRHKRFSTGRLISQVHYDFLTLQSNSERVEFNISRLKSLDYAVENGFDTITFFKCWDDYLKFLRQCTTTEVDEIFRRYRLLLELCRENVEILTFNAVMLEAMEDKSYLNNIDEQLFKRGLTLSFDLYEERIVQVRQREEEVFRYKQDEKDMFDKMKEMHRLFFGDMYHFPVAHQTIETTLSDSNFESVMRGSNRTKYEPILHSLHPKSNSEHVNRDNYTVILTELISQTIDISNHYVLDWWVYVERVEDTKRRIVVDVLYLKPDTLLDMLSNLHPRYGIPTIPRQNLKLDGHTIIPLYYAINENDFNSLRDKRDIHEERKQREMTVEDMSSVFKLSRRNMKELASKTFIPSDDEQRDLGIDVSNTNMLAMGIRETADQPSFYMGNVRKFNIRNFLYLGDMIYGYDSSHIDDYLTY